MHPLRGHVATIGGLKKIQRRKQRTAYICRNMSHYLYLDESCITNLVLKESTFVHHPFVLLTTETFMEGPSKWVIQVLASDHCPFTLSKNIWQDNYQDTQRCPHSRPGLCWAIKAFVIVNELISLCGRYATQPLNSRIASAKGDWHRVLMQIWSLDPSGETSIAVRHYTKIRYTL